MEEFDFDGWATKNDLMCSDGRIIRKDAFKHCDGETIPLVWNHDHTDPYRIIGHALLENRDEGVYAYCRFNDTDLGRTAKIYVEHGDIKSLSIYANQLKQQGPNVVHGVIREVSLVLAGANPGASIQNVIKHGDDVESEDEAYIYTGEEISIFHSDKEVVTENIVEDEKEDSMEHSEEKQGMSIENVIDTFTPEQMSALYALLGQAITTDEETVAHADAEEKKAEKKEEKKEEKEEKDDENMTIAEIFDTLTEIQKTAVYALIGQALEEKEKEEENEKSKGGNEEMKHNVFDAEVTTKSNTLSHADQAAILEIAKSSNVGSLKKAIEIFAAENADSLAHGYDPEEIGVLFPDYKDVHPGAPELVERDQKWVQTVLKKAHKSPVSRVRTRHADARANELKARGYNNREEEKALAGNLKLLMRTFDPQTVYVRDELHRDDIQDIQDFDVVAYQKTVMKHLLEERVALAALVGDGLEDTDKDKIHDNHIKPVWLDDELYTIHADVDIEAAKLELQGDETGAHFGENYIYAEAVITAALYAREKYRGKGQLDMYCTPHMLNVMLLARDLNGRRIYESINDLAKALNVNEIHTVEQFEGLTRTTKEGKTKKLLALFVNMANYQFGCAKGGEITSFDDFDIDFNQFKYLMETRLSGALTEIASAIALEEPVTV
jgi:hypothetical protein